MLEAATPTLIYPTAARFWVTLLFGSLLSGAALAQTTPAPTDGVVKPPAHVDPGIQVKPKPQASLPTPVVKPPPTVVPK